MQYLLTQEEYDALHKKQEYQIELSKKKLQALCTKIANEMPISRSWDKKAAREPWGCIITRGEEGDEWWCDECPVRQICPYEYQTVSK